MQNQPFHSCNVDSCIRNLFIKSKAPISAFSIERTCAYARDNSCRIFLDRRNWTSIPETVIKNEVEKALVSPNVPFKGVEKDKPNFVVQNGIVSNV